MSASSGRLSRRRLFQLGILGALAWSAQAKAFPYPVINPPKGNQHRYPRPLSRPPKP